MILLLVLEFFKEIDKKERNEDAFNYIKETFKGNEDLIKSFENFSNIYPSIIELNQHFDNFSLNLYDEVIKIVKDTEIIFFQTNEKIKIENKDNKTINQIKDLLILKNKIHENQKLMNVMKMI